MKGRAPFDVRPGEPPPPSTDPLALLNYALAHCPEHVELLDLARAVEAVALPDLVETGLRGMVVPPPAKLTISAPYRVGQQLAGPPEQHDAYILIHIDRQAIDAMDESRLLVLPPLGLVRPT